MLDDSDKDVEDKAAVAAGEEPGGDTGPVEPDDLDADEPTVQEMLVKGTARLEDGYLAPVHHVKDTEDGDEDDGDGDVRLEKMVPRMMQRPRRRAGGGAGGGAGAAASERPATSASTARRISKPASSA